MVNIIKTHDCELLHEYLNDQIEEDDKSLCTCDLFKNASLKISPNRKFLPFNANIFYLILQFEEKIQNKFLEENNILEDEFYFSLLYGNHKNEIYLTEENIQYLKKMKNTIFNNIIFNREVLYCSYFLKYYTFLSVKEIEMMLNRQNEKLSLSCGILLYLLENGDHRIQMHTLNTLFQLTSSKEIFQITLNLFIDMMYASHPLVQKLAEYFFLALLKKYTVSFRKPLFQSICRLISGKADSSWNQLQSALFYLKYDSFDIFRFFNENDFFDLKYEEVKIFISRNKKLTANLFSEISIEEALYGRRADITRLIPFLTVYSSPPIDSSINLHDLKYMNEGRSYEILKYHLIEYFRTGNRSIENLLFDASTEKIKKLNILYKFHSEYQNIEYLHFKFDTGRFDIQSEKDLIFFISTFDIEYLNLISYDFICYSEIFQKKILITVESYFTNLYSYRNMYYKVVYGNKVYYYEISYITYIDIPYIEKNSSTTLYLCYRMKEDTLFIIKSKKILL